MKQPKSKKNDVADTAALYVRLSRDDNYGGESYSISNQKRLLTKAAKEKGYVNLPVFSDDGVSGVTMERPGFNAMLDAVKSGAVSAVFVKDLSRLGRNYIEVGRLMDDVFPEYGTRLVSVSEGIDTSEGESELAPFLNIMSEWYARDISKKRRLSNSVRGGAGEPLGPPPYGYIRDPDNPKYWIVDEEAAAVVRRIFRMALDGYGTEQIAAALQADKILIPVHYWASKGIKRPNRNTGCDPFHWRTSTVTHILTLREYCGDIVNFKTYSISYKKKKRIPNEPDNMAIFPDVHKPIIDRAAFEKIQAKRGTTRKRKTKNGEKNMFSGLLVCADCGHNLNYHFNQGNPEIKYFNCSNYKGNRGTCQSTHYIRVDFLEQVVLGEIRRLTKFAASYEDEFALLVKRHAESSDEATRQRKSMELNTLQARDREIDLLFSRMYEDNVSGKLDDSRFNRMSARYSEEQAALSSQLEALKKELEQMDSRAMTSDMFVKIVRNYTSAKKLTPRMLNELIEKIEVHQADKTDGVNVQRLTIHYNCAGPLAIPEFSRLGPPHVSIRTRKGVMTSYAP